MPAAPRGSGRSGLASSTGIRPPRPDELETLRRIERDAGRMFAAIDMPGVAADEPRPVAELEAMRAAGGICVAVDAADRPVAYLLHHVIDGAAHIDQVSVAVAHARHGLGAALIEHLAETTLGAGLSALTLTTFRDVPWNAPYYRRLGFAVVEGRGQGARLRALLAREAASAAGPAPRVAMRRELTAET